MKRLMLTVLAALLMAAGGITQQCTWCEATIAAGEAVHWQRHRFCSESCRHEWYLDRRRCKICDAKVEPEPARPVRTDGEFVYMNFTPRNWDGYCDWCREGVKDGSIDPVRDRHDRVAAGDDDPPATPAGAAAPVAETRSRSPEPDDSEGFVLRILLWVGGIGAALVIVIRKLLR